MPAALDPHKIGECRSQRGPPEVQGHQVFLTGQRQSSQTLQATSVLRTGFGTLSPATCTLSQIHLGCWLPSRGTWGSVPSMSSSPCATDTMGWACTRVPEFSLSKGCPRGAGSPGWRLVCERAGWPTSLGRSGGKAPWWCGQWCNAGPGKWSTSALFRGQPRRL